MGVFSFALHLLCSVGLVDDNDISAAEVDVAWEVGGLVAKPVGVCHTDPEACKNSLKLIYHQYRLSYRNTSELRRFRPWQHYTRGCVCCCVAPLTETNTISRPSKYCMLETAAW